MRRAHRPRGQALVEFVLVAPMFLLLMFAILEGARFVFYYEMLNNAAREGARYAIVHGSASDCPSGPAPVGKTNWCDPDGDNVKTAVAGAAIGLVNGTLDVPDPIWTPAGSDVPSLGEPSTGTYERGNYVTVFVDYTYSTFIPVLPPITISAESSLVVNH